MLETPKIQRGEAKCIHRCHKSNLKLLQDRCTNLKHYRGEERTSPTPNQAQLQGQPSNPQPRKLGFGLLGLSLSLTLVLSQQS